MLKKETIFIYPIYYNEWHKDYETNKRESKSHASSEVQKSGAELSLKDIADIALTTLAFLSFGMFILQVLICITMNKDETNMTVLPMEETELNELPFEGVEEIRRNKRSTGSHLEEFYMTNELTRRMLFSIEAVIALQDNVFDSCHYWSICENLRYYVIAKSVKNYWLPMWSLGTAWLASKISSPYQIQTDYKFLLKRLHPILIGLMGRSCINELTQLCKLNLQNTTNV